MTKFNIPKRKYAKGDKKMVSMRLNVPLMNALEAVAKNKGMTTTDLVSLVLDQYLQWENKDGEDKKKSYR
jgi:hypothetical protein